MIRQLRSSWAWSFCFLLATSGLATLGLSDPFGSTAFDTEGRPAGGCSPIDCMEDYHWFFVEYPYYERENELSCILMESRMGEIHLPQAFDNLVSRPNQIFHAQLVHDNYPGLGPEYSTDFLTTWRYEDDGDACPYSEDKGIAYHQVYGPGSPHDWDMDDEHVIWKCAENN